MRKIALTLFIVVTTGELLSEIFNVGLLHILCKPLILPCLIFYYLSSTDPLNRSRPLILALAFSFFGDVLLMKPDYFIMGLIAFLISHVLYIFTYRQHQFDEREDALFGLQRIRLAFPIVLAGTGLVVILFPVLGDLKIPVIMYALVLVVMVLNALFRYGRTSSASFWLVFCGAILFMLSDSMLAINKFLHPFSYAGFWTMIAYIAAQFMIVRGLVLHPQK